MGIELVNGDDIQMMFLIRKRCMPGNVLLNHRSCNLSRKKHVFIVSKSMTIALSLMQRFDSAFSKLTNFECSFRRGDASKIDFYFLP